MSEKDRDNTGTNPRDNSDIDDFKPIVNKHADEMRQRASAPSYGNIGNQPSGKPASPKAKTSHPKVVDFDEIDPENARIRKNKQLRKTAKDGKDAAVGLAKVLIYIAAVVAISVFLAVNIINVANDVFAFVKDDTAVTVEIPEGAKLSDVADILKYNGIIRYPLVFRLYAEREIGNSKYLTGEMKSGAFELDPMMNYDTLIYKVAVSTYKPRESVRVTIPEGYTVDDIINLLIENGVGEKKDYIDAIQNFEYEYDFVKELEESGRADDPKRKYRLEGYLFPDTYDFFTNESEISVINKMLSNFDLKFEEIYRERAKELGMSIDDIVILASIVEKEAKYAADFPYISGVFHNRLDDSHRLESCATVLYVLGERKTRLSNEDTKLESPYNTYQLNGLTPGAISNPGLEAISAALYPEKTNYYYFFSLNDGTTVYSTNYSQHINKQNQAEAEGKF